MWTHLTTLWRYREMILNLVARDLKVKYKGSALGFAWSFLNPAIMITLYYLVFTLFAPGFREGIDNYGLFLIAGMWPWMTFASAVGKAAPQFILSQDLLRKVYFPREVLPISTVVAEFVNFGIGIALFILVLAFAGPGLKPQIWLLLPLVLALFALTTAVALEVSATDVFFRDMEQILNSSLTILFFATPIVYTMGQVRAVTEAHPVVGWVMPLNPLSWLLPAFRFAFLGPMPQDELPFPPSLIAIGALGISVVLLAIAYLRFKSVEWRIAEEV